MASGSFEFGTSNQYITGKTEWSSISNLKSNTSQVTAILYYKKSSTSTSATYGMFTGNININGSILSINKRITLNCNNTYVEIGRLTTNVAHNNDGTKSISISVIGGIVGTSFNNGNGSKTVVLDTIPRKSMATLSKNTFDIGETIKIFMNRKSVDFIHRIYLRYGSINKVIADNVIDEFTWNTGINDDLYSQIPSENVGVGEILVQTFNKTIDMKNLIGENIVAFNANVINCNPIFIDSNVSYYDANTNIVNITGNNLQIVQSLSKLVVKVTAATAKKGAAISKYIIKINGEERQIDYATTVEIGQINSSKNLTLEVVAIDTRGNSTTVKKSVTFLEWSLPNATIDLHRLNNYEDTTYLTVDTKYSSVNNKNDITIKYKYSTREDFESVKINLNEGDAVGIRSTDGGNSTVCCEIPASEIIKITNGRVVVKFSNENYITEEITNNGDYYNIIAHFQGYSFNQYLTEFILYRYSKSQNKVLISAEMPGIYLNSDIVLNVNKKAVSYKYIFTKSTSIEYDIFNKQQIQITCSKERIWYFKIYIKDKFGQIIYNIPLYKRCSHLLY